MEGIFKGLEKVMKLLLEAQQSCSNQRVNADIVCDDCKKLLKEWEKESKSKILEIKKQQSDKASVITNRISDEVPIIKELALAETLLLKAKKLKEKHQRIFPAEKTAVLSTVTNILPKESPECSVKSTIPSKNLKRFQHKNPAIIHRFRSKSKSPARKHLLTVHDGYSSSDSNRNTKINSPLLKSTKKFASGESTVVLSKSRAEQLQSLYGVVLLGGEEVNAVEKGDHGKFNAPSDIADFNSISRKESDDYSALGESIPCPSERFCKAFSFNLQARSKVKKLLLIRNEYAERFQAKLHAATAVRNTSSKFLKDLEAGLDDGDKENGHILCKCSSFPNWVWYPSASLMGLSSIPESLSYHSKSELCQFYTLTSDIQWYSFLLDLYNIIQDEVIPHFQELNMNDSNYYSVFRCLWSILCTEGRSFPILIHKT